MPRDDYLASVAAGLMPEPALTVSEWSDKHRILPQRASAEPGPWRTSRTPYLKAILDALSPSSPYHTVVFAKGAQVGAPLAIDTPIPTPDGWKPMEALIPGDSVFGSDGRPVKVIGTSKIFVGRNCYRVSFSDGESIVCDADHLWSVDVEKSAAADAGRITLSTREMVSRGKRSRRILYFRNGERNRYAIPLADHLRLPPQRLPIGPYTLGVWLGDGSASGNQVTTHRDDAEEMAANMTADGHATTVRKPQWVKGNCLNLIIEPKEGRARFCRRGHDTLKTGLYFFAKRGKRAARCQECIRQQWQKKRYGKALDPIVDGEDGGYARLRRAGLINNKHIPALYLRASLDQRLELLRGLMDTDGSIGDNGRCELTVADEQLAQDCLELIRSVGYKPTYRTRLTNESIMGKPVKHRSVHYRISFMAYRDRPVFKLKRKLSRMVSREGRRISETFRRRIVDIEPVESVPTKCIEVNSKDSLFLAGRGMIATHNTECGNNWLGYIIHHAPGPALAIMPTEGMARRLAKQRLRPMVEATPALLELLRPDSDRESGNNILEKEFAGGSLTITWASSATTLRSSPVRYLFMDEVDAYERNVGGEGDPLDIALRRTATFKRNRKIYMVSTPTIKETSIIWRTYLETDQRRYFVPCPHCGEYQTIDWARIVYGEGKQKPTLACVSCGTLIEERHKGKMLAAGEWRPTAEGADPGVIGFHLSAFYSPPGWYSWADAVADYRKAENHSERARVWWNTVAGEPVSVDQEGEKLDEGVLSGRRGAWDAEAIPDDVVCLTAGVDVQDDRLEVSLIGWCERQRARVLAHSVLYGSPGEVDVWQSLDKFLVEPRTAADDRRLRVVGVCVDTGGHHTAAVYRYCGGKAGRGIYPTKGVPGAKPAWPARASRSTLHKGAHVWAIGVDTIKDWLRGSLAVKDEAAANHVSFSGDLDEAYFAQLLVEKRVVRYDRAGRATREWVKPKKARNEAWDCLVLAYAALEAAKTQRRLALRLPRRPQKPQNAPEAAKTPSEVSTHVRRPFVAPGRVRGGFVNGWRR